jgi:hypothetical protein
MAAINQHKELCKQAGGALIVDILSEGHVHGPESTVAVEGFHGQRVAVDNLSDTPHQL